MISRALRPHLKYRSSKGFASLIPHTVPLCPHPSTSMSAFDGVHGTVCNAQQYQQSLLTNPHRTISCLTQGQSIGLALTAGASLLSLAAVVVIFVLIGRNVLHYKRALPNGGWKLLQVPADVYMLSLFVYDILQAMGGILDIRWAHDGIVTGGHYCTAQGVTQQIGQLGVALITLIITVHSFVVALWNIGTRARHFALGVVGLASLFTALWVGIGNGVHKNFVTPTPYWCWIGPEYKLERLAGEYIWMWIALFASVIMYIPLYFWTKGRLSVDPDKWYKFRLSESNVGYPQRRAALGMLFYPLAYSLMVLPLSIARWSLFNHKKVSSAATFFGVSMFNLSGAINVLLFLIVRPKLLLFSPPKEFSEPDVELRHSSTGSTIFPDSNHSPQPTGVRLIEDVGNGVWNPTLQGSGNSVAPSRVDSRPRSDDI
ncbi:hypothetical protein BJY52DRAFT_921209 [Lactarius psammicola]|nr:hypothetical protein BJY52DRAFT_921209 [Lactarius psammicola]